MKYIYSEKIKGLTIVKGRNTSYEREKMNKEANEDE